MKIVFPHIPKCAGTSIKQQIASRHDIHFDYFNHPTWVHEDDRRLGREAQRQLKVKLSTKHDWLVFGHFCASDYDELSYDCKILLLRDPFDRALSHYNYIKQILPDNEVTRRRHAEVSMIKAGAMSFREFAELEHIKFFYRKYYLRDIRIDSRLAVYSTDDLQNAFARIQKTCDLTLDSSVVLNKSLCQEGYEPVRGSFSDEMDLYAKLLARTV